MAADPEATRHPNARRGFLAVSATVSILLAATAAFGIGAYAWADRQLAKRDVISGTNPDTGTKTIGGPCEKHACNFLILGSDSRTGLSGEQLRHFGNDKDIGGQRSDTIILVHVPEGAGAATIVHFPRDLWVDIPGKGWGKINGAFEGGVDGGGPDLVARTVERLTGLHINHFLYVNLAGFESIVNALGGVPICVDRPMIDPKTELDIPKAGCYTLDGHDALAFVRTRSLTCDAIPDFARIARQQQFLRAVLAKVLAPTQIANAPSLVPALGRSIVKDDELSAADLIALADELNGVNTGDADFRSVTGTPKLIYPPGYPNGLSIVQISSQADELFRRLRENRPLGALGLEQLNTPPSPAIIRTAVFDMGGAGTAVQVQSILTRGGFDMVGGPAAANGRFPKEAIYYRGGAEELAKVVQGFAPTLPIVSAKDLPGDHLDVAVVISSRYASEPPGGGTSQPPTTCA